MMNESEAKIKCCPRLIVGVNLKYSNGSIRPEYRCIGSDCAAWRWKMVLDSRAPVGKNAHLTDIDGNRLGFCGLAGKP